MTPAVSIIIPTHNRREALRRAIASVLAQSLTDFELIIVDDGSTDGTAQFVDAIDDRRVRPIVLPIRGGANAARNLGVAAARSELISLLDSDDVYLPDRLAQTIPVFQRCAEIELVLSSYLSLDSQNAVSVPCVNPKVWLPHTLLERALVAHALFIAGSAITVRKSTLLRVGGFDEAVGRMQDRDFLLRVARSTGAVLLSEIDWHKHNSEGSISSSRADYLDALAVLFERHPMLPNQYSKLARYLVARPILAQLLQGHLRISARLLASSRTQPQLRCLGWPSLRNYVSGKKIRAKVRRELFEALPFQEA